MLPKHMNEEGGVCMEYIKIQMLQDEIMNKLFEVYNSCAKSPAEKVNILYSMEEFVAKSPLEADKMVKVESLVRKVRNSAEMAVSYPQENLDDIIKRLELVKNTISEF